MMLKAKICATVFVLYEIIAVLLLHDTYTCPMMFSGAFCADSVFKYFMALFAVPALVGLILMWIMHIVHAIRRRHSFMYRAQEAVSDVATTIKKTLKESVSSQDIEKYIMVALMAGVKKFSDKNPEIKKSFGNIMNALAGGAGEYMEMDDDDMTHAAPARKTVRRTQTKSTAKRRTSHK